MLSTNFVKEFIKQWGFWPMGGGVPDPPPPVTDPVTVTPPAEPVVDGEPPTDDDDDLPVEPVAAVTGPPVQLEPPEPEPPIAAPPPTKAEPTMEQQLEQLAANFYRDPLGTIDSLITLRMGPLADKIIQSEATQAEGSVKTRENYDILKKDVDEFMINVPPHLKANPKAWDIAYFYAKGKNADKLGKPGARPSGELPSSTVTGASPTVKVSLTAEEKRAAKQFNMSEEEYSEWK
jgi:hypothetical protein